jgi:hypothetical protein
LYLRGFVDAQYAAGNEKHQEALVNLAFFPYRCVTATMNNKFGPPDGDIILRTPTRDFRVHKLVLSLASPIFRDMFSIPQPTPVVRGADIGVVDVTDPPEALDLILRFIYPLPPPNVDSLDLLVEGLVVADKYDIDGARAELRLRLAKFMKENPLRVYAIASRFGFEEEAEAASSLTTGTYLPALVDLPDELKNITATAYHRLVRLHEKYRDEVEDAIDGVLFEPGCSDCKLTKVLAESRMRTKLVRIICRGEPMSVNACIRELGIACKSTCITKFVGIVSGKLGGKCTIVRT